MKISEKFKKAADFITEFLESGPIPTSDAKRKASLFCRKFNKRFSEIGLTAIAPYHEDGPNTWKRGWSASAYKCRFNDLKIFEASDLRIKSKGRCGFRSLGTYTAEWCQFIFITAENNLTDALRHYILPDFKNRRKKARIDEFTRKLERQRNCTIVVKKHNTRNNWEKYQYKVIAEKLGVDISNRLLELRKRQPQYLSRSTEPGNINFEKLLKLKP